MMCHAIGYIRVSTEEQTSSGLGLADQRLRIEASCRLRGLELTKIISDVGVSREVRSTPRTAGTFYRSRSRLHNRPSAQALPPSAAPPTTVRGGLGWMLNLGGGCSTEGTPSIAQPVPRSTRIA